MMCNWRAWGHQMGWTRRLLSAVGLLLTPLLSRTAVAAGLFLAPPGVGPLGQAGAVVTSARDPLALVYNPGALAWAEGQVLLDGAVPWFTTRYTRRVVDAGPDQAQVTGHPLALVSPNIGVVWAPFGPRRARVAALVTTDYPLVQRWPDSRQAPNTPQRYATGGFAGTALARAMVGAAFAPFPKLALGASAQLLLGSMATETTLSTCDGVICHQPENPSYDATASLRTSPIAVPGLGLGAVLKVWRALELGLSYSSGFAINIPASLRVTLPQAPLYAGAQVLPEKPTARLQLSLPSTWRLGARARLPHHVQVEAAVTYVPWHVQRSLTVSDINAAIANMLAIDSFRIRNITVPKNLRDTVSGHLAVRWSARVWEHAWRLSMGLMVEPSAVPNPMLTAMAVDLPKGLMSFGAGWRRRRTQLSLSYGFMGMLSRRIKDSAVKQINPTFSADSAQLTAVGNGFYRGSAHLFGISAQQFF